MSNKMITHAITTLITMSLTSFSAIALAAQENQEAMTMAAIPGMEKCYGIAKAGQNDCSTASHGCASETKTDSDKTAWVFVPTGLCTKIVGSSLSPPAKT